VSPLKNSAIVSASSVKPIENWSSMARQEGDSVPYSKQEYSAIMKGMFSLDLNMIGTFSSYNKTGFQNLSNKLKEEAINNKCVEIEDPFYQNQKLLQMPAEIRKSRALDTIKALKNISGGAMQTNNMADVTPKFIVLATTNTGNHPFSHIVKSRGERDEQVVLNIDGIEEVLNDYKDTIEGKVFIGKEVAFLMTEIPSLNQIKEKFSDLVEIGSINEMIDAYCEQLKNQIE
jgi:CRISPR-associated protein Cas7/Cst2/DevR, subtype I-B/TNEAP